MVWWSIVNDELIHDFLMDRERFRENLLEGDIVLLFLEDFSSEVSAIEGVIRPDVLRLDLQL